MQGVLECASGLLQSNYRAQGQQALNHQQSALQQLLSQVSHTHHRSKAHGTASSSGTQPPILSLQT